MLVEEMESIISKQSEYIGGTITLGGSNTPGTYIMPAVIGEMKKRYPSVTVNLHIANTSEIMTLVENGTLDVAVNGGDCNYSSFIYCEELFSDKLIIVASPMNLLCNMECITIDDLAEECFIVHEKTSQLYSNYKIFIGELNIPENIGMYLGSIDAIKHAVNANLGISIMPYYAVKSEIEMGLLKELKINYENFRYPYNLIYNKSRNLSFTTQKFIEVLKEVCGSLK
jgi:DNA-binding transcriptional LysR family regulator